MKWLPGLAVSVFLACPAFAFADGETGPARLVADLAPGSVPIQGSISGFTRLGSRAVFLRGEQDAGQSLWITDGTVEGTSSLGVLCPPCQTAVALGANGNVAFYRVDAGYPVYETAVWRTDGTPAGTFPLTNDLPMSENWPPPPAGSIQGGLLFFTACTAELGCELWSSDGSREGTAPVGEIVPGPESADIQEFAAAGDRAFLIVSVAGEPAALWVADGTARGLRRLRTAPEAYRLVAGADRAFFLAWNGGRWEVWASDGTGAGTRPVTSFGHRERLLLPEDAPLTLLDGRVWFVADDGAHGFELWSAGLKPESLRRASDFPTPNPEITDFGKAGDRIVLVTGGYSGNPKLWSSRGDFRSTAQLTGCPGGCPRPIGPLAALEGRNARRLVFYGHDREGGGIWVTDGTAAGTRLLQRTVERYLSQAVSRDGLALIEITDEYETGQLWVTDGTAAGTSLVTQGGPIWSHYYGWRSRLEAGSANGRLIFTGIAEADAEELLWRSDGSPAGSWPLLGSKAGRSTPLQQLTPFRDGVLVQSCNPQDGGEWNQEMRFVQGAEATLLISRASESCSSTVPVDLGDAAVFVKSESEASVWRTDGTPEGTAALIPGSAASIPAALARFGEEAAIWILLLPAPGVWRSELWLTDGTPEGTRRHLDLPDVQTMYGLTDIGGRLLFLNYVGSEEGAGLQLWVSDGTRAGTGPLTDTIGYAGDQLFVEAGGRFWFPFGELGGPIEIWGTDGTAAGTGPAVTAASGAFEPQRLSATGGRLYFAAPRASDPDGRLLPWVSDGTDAGTELLADVTLGEPIFAPLDRSPFVELDGRVWFAASDPRHGDELWSTDGTPEGTARLLDIAPGLLGSYPRSLAAWNGRLWFRARDAVHGMELWTSDGTAEGTRLVHDIAPGPSWSTPGALDWLSPVDLTGTETGLYFPASDGEHGRELWVLPITEP
jgi:ELWxxDGT repeat protein